MIGAIAGDIVGSVYEQANIRSTDFPLFQPASRFTDDTVMALAVADALIHGRDFAANLRRFCLWYPRAGYGAMFKAWALDDTRGPYQSFGNGSAMRVTAVAHAFETADEVLAAAMASAAVSHDHPEGIKGAQSVALAALRARQGWDGPDILEEVTDRFGYDLGFDLDDIRATYSFDATCQGSVPQAFVAFREARDFEHCLRLAVSIGGDSDTIACMAGSMAGPYFGAPAAIIAEVQGRLDDRLRGVLALFMQRYPS